VLAALSLFLGVAGVITAPSASAAYNECYANFSGGYNDYFLPCPNDSRGYQTHIFWDDNSTANPTSLHLWNCSSNPNIDLFYYQTGYEPGWVKVGTTKRFWCLNTDGGWQSWGRQTRVGWYGFYIANHRGTGPLRGSLHGGW
jgi:hypothetical protein